MIFEVEVLHCNEIYCSFNNITSNKSVQEIESNGLDLKPLKDHIIKNDGNTKPDNVILPIANPFIAMYLILIVCAAIISNSVVLIVLSARRKNLHSFQLCFICLCISDLLFSLLLHPMSIATSLGFDAHTIFNDSGCLYFGVLALFFGSYDMVIHSVIAVLRYVNLYHQARIKWFSKRAVLISLLAAAIYSAIWCIGPVVGIGKYVTFEVGCTMAFTDDSLSGRTFVNCAFIFVFFIPLTVTISSYVAIAVKAGKQRRILERIGTVTSSRTNNRLAIEMKLIRLTSVIAAAYILVWLPYAIVCLTDTYGNADDIPWIFRIVAALFCKTGTATNPVLYLFMSRGFRKETAETMRLLWTSKKRDSFSKIFTYSSSQKSSSCRSHSQISLRSSLLGRLRKEHSSSVTKPQSSSSTFIDDLRTASLRHETCV